MEALLTAIVLAGGALAAPGDWPEPRQNPRLTAIQPLPGRMTAAPSVIGALDLGRTAAPYTTVSAPEGGGVWGVAVIAGAVHCFDQAGTTRWISHPENLNFTALSAAADLDGDGRPELLLQAGRAADPFGAAIVLDLADGAVRWRHDVEPMSYAWYLHTADYLPASPGQEVAVLMQGYPPDPENGYMALFSHDGARGMDQRWRYDFDAYTCFPSLLRNDVDRDGVTELIVQTHSRMWILDPETGARESFVQWDVSPANVRSYGRIEFADLNGDGWDDFLCIADFAQHHEVLLNRAGTLEKAWSHGWDESVTTGKVATTWPEPLYGDVNGDGRLELVVSVFNAAGDQQWETRIYDAVSGDVLHRIAGVAAAALHDVTGDGAVDLLANQSGDPSLNQLEGARLFEFQSGAASVLWEDAGARALLVTHPGSLAVSRNSAAFRHGGIGTPAPLVRKGGQVQRLERNLAGHVECVSFVAPASPPAPAFARVPETQAGPAPTLLAADLLGEGRNQLVLYAGGTATAWRFQDGRFSEVGQWLSDTEPALADLDGDGAPEITTVITSAVDPPVITARTPSQKNRTLWEQRLAPPGRAGLAQPRKAYVRTGRFTGRAAPDLYVFVGTPVARSLVLDGSTGAPIWEKGEIPGQERYWAPTVNQASATDFDGDGAEDLVFTNPDYYCIASGRTGELLLGPAFPPDIFQQPSQGLYTLPALLPGPSPGDVTVCLTSGHFFQGVMSLDARPYWHRVPLPGESRAAAEGFLRGADGAWLMGFGRQNGAFACVRVRDGALLWEIPAGGAAADAVTGDVDGDGHQEFVFGTTHGHVWAIGDRDGQPHTVWQTRVEEGVQRVILADVTGDGATEVIVATALGRVLVLTAQ